MRNAYAKGAARVQVATLIVFYFARWKGSEAFAKWKANWNSRVNYEVCYVCQEGNCSNENLMLCCDECPQSYHMLCLDPPIAKEDIPDGSWYCQHCKIAKAHAKGGTKGKPKELPFKPVASWKEGSKLEIQYEGNQQWYPATIAMKSKKRVKIAYDGWDRKFSEWVKKTSIRIAPPGVHITDKSKVPAVPQFARHLLRPPTYGCCCFASCCYLCCRPSLRALLALHFTYCWEVEPGRIALELPRLRVVGARGFLLVSKTPQMLLATPCQICTPVEPLAFKLAGLPAHASAQHSGSQI